MSNPPVQNHPDMQWDMAIPNGWKLVPMEPTEAMFEAWVDGIKRFYAEEKALSNDTMDNARAAAYRAMIAAAPPPPQQDSKE